MSEKERGEVTRILEAVRSGDHSAYDRLLQLIHSELKMMARGHMRRERPGHTLQPTALVNEAYLRLARGNEKWDNRGHFFGAAAEAMRQVLVESRVEGLPRNEAGKRSGSPLPTSMSRMRHRTSIF